MWAGRESVLSLDGGTFTIILVTVKLVLGDFAPAVIYGSENSCTLRHSENCENCWCVDSPSVP